MIIFTRFFLTFQAVDYTLPLMDDTASFTMLRPTKSQSWNTFFGVFDPYFWKVLFVAMLISLILFKVIKFYWSKEKGK